MPLPVVDASAPLYEKFASGVENGQAKIDQVLSLAGGSWTDRGGP